MGLKNCKKCTSCSLWGDKFWNNFFHPRQKGIFLVLFLIVLVIAFTLCYILLAIYYEALSKHHSDAYVVFFFSNITHLIVGILVLHFLTVPPKQLTILRCVTIYSGILITLVLAITAIALWNSPPSNSDMKEYVVNFFFDYNRVPRIYGRLHQDSICCGINGFEDFIPKGKNQIERLPDSCCVKSVKKMEFRRLDCGNFRGQFVNASRTMEEVRKDTSHFHIKGCFFNTTFANLKKESPLAYQDLSLTIDWAFTSLVLLASLAVTFSYYACYKLLHDTEGSPEWGQDEFKIKLRQSLRCFSPRRYTTHPPSTTASFAQVHEQAKPSQLTTNTVSTVSSSATTSSVQSSNESGSTTTTATTDVKSNQKQSMVEVPVMINRTSTALTSAQQVEIDIDDQGHIVIIQQAPQQADLDLPPAATTVPLPPPPQQPQPPPPPSRQPKIRQIKKNK